MAIVQLLFLVALVAAVFDWMYKRKGGRKPSAGDYRGLVIAIGLVVILVIALLSLGGDPSTLGGMTGFMVMLVTILWQWRRYRVRRAHPLT